MGCDIHLFVEKRNKDGIWEAVYGEDCMLSWYKNQLEKATQNNDDKNINFYKKRVIENSEPSLDWVYDGRNYDLFALLADVRNGNGIDPISEPKGIPDDSCEEIKGESEDWGCDGHSHSYYTLAELKEYIDSHKDDYYESNGYVSRSEYVEFIKDKCPHSWCGGIYGGDVCIIPNDDMYKIILGTYKNYNSNKSYYTYITWKSSIISDTGLDKIVAKIATISDDNDEDVRMVFWFDN